MHARLNKNLVFTNHFSSFSIALILSLTFYCCYCCELLFKTLVENCAPIRQLESLVQRCKHTLLIMLNASSIQTFECCVWLKFAEYRVPMQNIDININALEMVSLLGES